MKRFSEYYLEREEEKGRSEVKRADRAEIRYRYRRKEGQDQQDPSGGPNVQAEGNEANRGIVFYGNAKFLLKLAKMSISRHQERMIEFFSSLAKHDDDMKNMLNKFKDKRRNYLPQDLRSANKDKDIVVPSMADTGGPV